MTTWPRTWPPKPCSRSPMKCSSARTKASKIIDTSKLSFRRRQMDPGPSGNYMPRTNRRPTNRYFAVLCPPQLTAALPSGPLLCTPFPNDAMQSNPNLSSPILSIAILGCAYHGSPSHSTPVHADPFHSIARHCLPHQSAALPSTPFPSVAVLSCPLTFPLFFTFHHGPGHLSGHVIR